MPKGNGGQYFNDEDLNALETQALSANQTLKVSMARLEQARATAAIQVATLFPTVSTSPGVTRQRLSGNRPTNGVPITLKPITQNAFSCRSRSVMKSICLAAEGAVLRRRKPPIKPTPRTLRMCGYCYFAACREFTRSNPF